MLSIIDTMTFAPISMAVPIATYPNHCHASLILSGFPWANMNLNPTTINIITAMTAPMGMAIFTKLVKSAVISDELRGLQMALGFEEQGVEMVLPVGVLIVFTAKTVGTNE